MRLWHKVVSLISHFLVPTKMPASPKGKPIMWCLSAAYYGSYGTTPPSVPVWAEGGAKLGGVTFYR